jgi:hypothetical protein
MILKRKSQLLAASVIASTTLFGVAASPALAVNLVPQQTGEIDVGLGCLDTCINVDSIFASIVSLTDSTTGTQSRLFVDYFGSDDVEETYGQGVGSVTFETKDAGTNASGFWFRPSEVEANGSNEEQGQLEVGTYLFNFSRELAELTIDFFDTESKKTTGILAINGQRIDKPAFVAKGADGNIVSQTFTNVTSIEMKLGSDDSRNNRTGDGVNVQMAATVPEPASILGLIAIAGVGMGLKKRATGDVAQG